MSPLPRRPWRWRPSPLLALLLLASLAGCNYTFKQGGGLPPHVRTIFLDSFENETAEFGVEQQLDQKLMERIPRGLGIRVAGRETADAILTGVITRYDDQAQNFRPGDPRGNEALQHQVMLTAQVAIVDTRRRVYLWRSQVMGQGLYRPESQDRDVAWAEAIDQIIQKIIDGAQSQW
jgi:hypothetical protein